jgi:hypothetical protein
MTAQTKKTFLNGLLTSAITIAVCIITLSVTGVRGTTASIETKIDKKLDKTEYDKDQIIVNERLRSCEIEVKSLLIELKDGQTEILKIQTENTTDLIWIKKSLDQKRK